jgi:hypothetical protein
MCAFTKLNLNLCATWRYVIYHPRSSLQNKNLKYIRRDVTPFSLVETYRSFGGTYWLHLQGRVTKRNNHQTTSVSRVA